MTLSFGLESSSELHHLVRAKDHRFVLGHSYKDWDRCRNNILWVRVLRYQEGAMYLQRLMYLSCPLVVYLLFVRCPL